MDGSRMDRRDFLTVAGLGAISAADLLKAAASKNASQPLVELSAGWCRPGAEFSMAPFWFWNDRLTEDEISRQMADFRDHGVYAFVIHPRVGLPRDIGWMSNRMLHFMRFTIEEARRTGMWVVLYDEGMYPSGSSCGQVVAENPAYQCRGLVCIDLDEVEPGRKVSGAAIGSDGEPSLSADQTLVAVVKRKLNGHRLAIVDRPVNSVIRGLHFRDEDPPRRSDRREVAEDTPPAGDILNPEAVACFIRLVYQRYHDEFGTHFGKTVKAIFTDEPNMTGRLRERGVVAGTTGILDHVNRLLGYDFTPYLPALWHGDEPEAARRRNDYHRALQMRLEETYYAPIRCWCDSHNIELTGHPAKPDDIGHLRHFHIPGQDIVWRYIEPAKPSALEGAQSTQAKCASSAMIHLGRRRNSNEFCGAYGHDFTFEEMQWLANWLLVRGCSLLYPHAFYYSIRGPRIDERPPDVGPNSTWWPQFRPFADRCARLAWLNTDSRHVCSVAILGLNDSLPWRSAKICFQHQRDFNYLEARHLWEDAEVAADGIHIAGMHYRALVVELGIPDRATKAIDTLEKAGRILRWQPDTDPEAFIRKLDELAPPDVKVSPPAPDLRLRHVVKEGLDWYILFNEGESDIRFKLGTKTTGTRVLLDPQTAAGRQLAPDAEIALAPHAVHVLAVKA